MNKLPDEEGNKIKHLLRKGYSIRLIASTLSCAKGTVQRYKDEMWAAGEVEVTEAPRNKGGHPDHRKPKKPDYHPEGAKMLAVAVLQRAVEDYRYRTPDCRRWKTAMQLLHGISRGPSAYTSMLEFCCGLAGLSDEAVLERMRRLSKPIDSDKNDRRT